MSEHEVQQQDAGTVVAIDGKKVRVEVVRTGGCKSCSMRGMCFGRNTPAVFDLTSELDLHIGDQVELEISPGSRVLSSLLVFGLPMVFLFGGFIVSSFWLQELPAIGLAFAATLLSFLLIRYIDHCIGGKLQVRIGRKI